MSMYVDIDFINRMSHLVDKFKRKGNYLWNFRCPFCGDSIKDKNKARGYTYSKKGGLFYKCHNCSIGTSLGGLIKHLDNPLYEEYCLERYKEGDNNARNYKTPDFENLYKKPVFKKERNLLDKMMTPLDRCSDDNIALKYIKQRKIPKKFWKTMYHIDEISKVGQLSKTAKDKIKGKEPRLVLPILNRQKRLIGIICRALDDNKVKYLNIKINEDEPQIYGLDTLDLSKRIYVVEGAFDSLFLDNAIAVGTSDLKRASLVISDKNRMTLIPDNQPRNKEICKIIDRHIKMGYNIVIWPDNLEGKDINEMYLDGISIDEIKQIIDDNTFNNLEAELKFQQWSKWK